MEIRNIQRTGKMHYFYLPTSWCRDRKITSKSQVRVSYAPDGSLTISPELSEKKPKHLQFSLKDDDSDIIHKLVVASYINPAGSFEISLEKPMDPTKLLNQKRLISLESVEIEEKRITCEGTVTVQNPELLLKTMVKKIRNMMLVMQKSYEPQLIERYEDEIDRSRMLIDKAIISSLLFAQAQKVTTIELYYISQIAKELERMVDHLIKLEKKDMRFLSEILSPIDLLQEIVENPHSLTLEVALLFTRAVARIRTKEIRDVRTYEMERMKQNLVSISEIVMDWMVTRKIEA